MTDLSRIKNLIIDMDGVLWRGEAPLPGLQELFGRLRTRKLGYILATNNATKIADDYVEKLSKFGVQVPAERILGSAEATATFLREKYPASKTVFAVGEKGIYQALEAAGFTWFEARQLMNGETTVDHVVVGLSRKCSYQELACAVQQVNKGARFVGTNPDVTYPTENGLFPGAGALIAFVQAATGVEPTIIGKPHPPLFNEALRRLSGRPDDTAIVGDRLGTDILGGRLAGLYTILVLSGVTQADELKTCEHPPDQVVSDLHELARALA